MANLKLRPSDKDELILNPITGKLDLIRIFNVDRIITCQRNSLGHSFKVYDPETDNYTEDGEPRVVTDNDGNVIVLG